jgi:hypothetical protein
MRGLARCLLLLPGLLALASCDTFFRIDATVTACDTGAPLEGVAVVSHLDQGFGEEDHHLTTDAAGRFHLVLNEPDGVTATLTLTKVGYQTWTHQYQGQPTPPVAICLDPTPIAP